MSARGATVTATDVALLRYLAQEGSIVAACRRAGISRDRATYRLARLETAFGGPAVTSQKGGRDHGRSRLTALGDRIVRQGFDAVELLGARPVGPVSWSNLLRGVYHLGPPPTVTVGSRVAFRVAFRGVDGERVAFLLDPESVLIARRRFVSSARNVLAGSVESVHRGPTGSSGWSVGLRVGSVRLRAAVTEEPLRELGIRRGARLWLYIKATALRRVSDRPVRGPARSGTDPRRRRPRREVNPVS